MRTYCEPAKNIPVINEVDVLITGGGPAGIGAALGAARNGAKTLLLEQTNCIGGMATSGMMSHWCGGTDSPLLEEIISRQALTKNDKRLTIPHERLKTVLFDMMIEAGIVVQLHTRGADAIMENEQIVGVITESKSGREAIMSKVVIDASGDGDIAALSGASYTLGRENDHKCQPVTLMFKISNVDYTRAVFPGSFESYMKIPKGEIQALGKSNLPFPAGHVLLYKTIFEGEVCVNMTNAINIDGTNVRDLTKAEIICRQQMDAIVKFLQEFVPGYEKCRIHSSAQYVGVRETRHFHGLYTIKAEDIVKARIFDDWIATRNHFNFDIHNVTGCGLDKNGAQKEFLSAGKYTIPYRSCVPISVDGLLLAGRNISGTHKAHSNFRVMPICLNIGQGIGTAAAVAVKQNVLPREVDINEVQRQLIRQGVNL